MRTGRPSGPDDADGRLRADARRNQAQVLAAARDVFVERGGTAPLEEIAERAGVGIGTLYRRFGNRQGLLRAVVLRALDESREAAEEALELAASAEGVGLRGLAHYMHRALDARVSAVIPVALDRLDLDDPEVADARESSASATERLIEAAHDDGSLPQEVTFADIGTLLVRLSRPLPGTLPRETDAEFAHRHLDLVVAGLAHGAEVLHEKGLSRAQLRRLGTGEDGVS